mgnify:CR=1 FL=1
MMWNNIHFTFPQNLVQFFPKYYSARWSILLWLLKFALLIAEEHPLCHHDDLSTWIAMSIRNQTTLWRSRSLSLVTCVSAKLPLRIDSRKTTSKIKCPILLEVRPRNLVMRAILYFLVCCPTRVYIVDVSLKRVITLFLWHWMKVITFCARQKIKMILFLKADIYCRMFELQDISSIMFFSPCLFK